MSRKSLLDNPYQTHHITVQTIRNLIFNSGNTAFYGQKDRSIDIANVDSAHGIYIHAKNEFSVQDTNKTMIALNGAWARLNRVMMELEEKYVAR